MTISRRLRRRLFRRRQSSQKSTSGFTLLELLIAVIIGSVIISGLMYLVIEMLQIERRETAVDNTQRDMKRAMEYIASDVSEAIYVYVPVEGTGWPDAISNLGAIEDFNNVVLAFWRPDFEDDNDLPTDAACDALPEEEEQDCNNLRDRRGSYTLVVYEVIPNDAEPWDGEARLVRHQLRKYSNLPDLMANYEGDGPFDPESGLAIFETWDPDDADINASDPEGDVLVDFVAHPTDDRLAEASCDGVVLKGDEEVVQVPLPETDTPRSFYTCIRPSVLNDEDNQSLEIFLRGDFEPRAGSNAALRTNALNTNSLLPTLRTGVFVQGIIGYDPDS
ncbi:MAG: PilW family protein [Leptolyngbyaceae cyanobacterium]